MKNVILILGVIVIAIFGIRFLVPPQSMEAPKKDQPTSAIFQTPVKSPHWASTTPQHASTLAAVPINVVVDVDFDLAPPSQISIVKDNKEYGVGQTTIDASKLAMRRAIDPSAPDGVYTVNYTACWPDKSCHDGTFQFAIDPRLANEFEDHRGTPDVTISLKDIALLPKKIRINKNTRVTWINNDTVVHYINTDSHPAHTYYPKQNSTALKPGEAYAFMFTQPGEYPYHCSAHADTMTGSLLVED